MSHLEAVVAAGDDFECDFECDLKGEVKLVTCNLICSYLLPLATHGLSYLSTHFPYLGWKGKLDDGPNRIGDLN